MSEQHSESETAPHTSPRTDVLEFSSWAEYFRRTMSAGMIVLLGVVLAQSYFYIGGVDAQYLVYTFGLLTLAVGAQILIFWARIDRGFSVSGATLALFPWLALLLADAFFLSDTPWRARYDLCVNLLPVMAFFTAMHASREPVLRWRMIGILAALTLLSGLTDFLIGETASDKLELAAAASVGDAVRTVFGAFGHRAGIGAALLLGFFPMAMLAFSPRFKLWTRIFGGYMAVLFLFGIVFTRHVGVYFGLFAGGILAVFLLVKRTSRRIALLAVIVAGAFISVPGADSDVGIFKQTAVPASVERAFPDDVRAAGTKYLLPHAALEMFKEHPIFGIGSGRFADEFEKFRPPQWQTNPRTSGSVYLHVLAENGIVGALLLFAPLAVLFIFAVRACVRMPWVTDTDSAKLHRKMGILDLGALPEPRIALATTLSGLLGVAVVFAIDYPRPIPGVLIACAILGGIAVFLAGTKRRRRIVSRGRKRHVLAFVAFAGPIVAFLLFLPSFRAESEFQKAEALLDSFFVKSDTGRTVAGTPDYALLADAEFRLRSALGKVPDHGDAWNALAQKFIFDCRRDPENTPKYGRLALRASEHALAASQSVPAFFQSHAVAETVAGNFETATADVRKVAELAPFNVPLMLTNAEMLRSFPHGTADAAALLERISAIVPASHYAENMRALTRLGGTETKSGDTAVPVGDDYAVPEF